MSLKIYQVDAFTSRAFAGNPAAVCPLDRPRSDEWMQSLALEMNLSETAFVESRPDGFNLRWFTPTVEVKLCGHATLASAHTLWEEGLLGLDQQARFFTLSGWLTADKRNDWIELDFPAKPVSPADLDPELTRVLGTEPSFAGRNGMTYLLLVESEDGVRSLAPDLEMLKKLPIQSLIVTAPSASADYDFVSRFFAPRYGIDEDPVTGSAHCSLGPFWGERLGKTEMTGYQASARGGIVRVRLAGDRVKLGGQAVTVMRGELVGL
jgi:PhzF family phenazine biosynthesis protein